MKKISNGDNILSLLKKDYEKSLEDLKSSKKKIEDLKIQILQNDALITETEKNCEKYQRNMEGLKAELLSKFLHPIL